MGLLETIQKAAATAINATGNIKETVYYRPKNTVTYNPTTGTQTETGAVLNTEYTDIAITDSATITSVSTDFTAMNIPTDGRYIKIHGFTNANNNGFFKPLTVAAKEIVLDTTALTAEIAGNTNYFDGPYHQLSGIITGFRSKEEDNKVLPDSDQKLLIPGQQFTALSIVPKQPDRVWIDNEEWVVIRFDTDSAEALYIIRIRNWKFYKGA